MRAASLSPWLWALLSYAQDLGWRPKLVLILSPSPQPSLPIPGSPQGPDLPHQHGSALWSGLWAQPDATPIPVLITSVRYCESCCYPWKYCNITDVLDTRPYLMEQPVLAASWHTIPCFPMFFHPKTFVKFSGTRLWATWPNLEVGPFLGQDIQRKLNFSMILPMHTPQKLLPRTTLEYSNLNHS